MNKGKDVRERERAKNKGGRGGGKKFSIENEDELAIREKVFSNQRDNRVRRRGDDEEDSEEETSESPLAEAPTKPAEASASQETVFRLPAKSSAAAAAASEESDDEEEIGGASANPNRQPGAVPTASRREREAAAAAKAKEDYMRKHLAGETEQARLDMERLALVRRRREEQARQREAEGRAPGWSADGIDSDADDEDILKRPQKSAVTAPAAPAVPLSEAAAKKKAAAAAPAEEAPAVAADGGPPKLKAMEIKAMNGDALKDSLKARGLSIQGQKKDLIKRLSDYEAGRP